MVSREKTLLVFPQETHCLLTSLFFLLVLLDSSALLTSGLREQPLPSIQRMLAYTESMLDLPPGSTQAL